MPYTLVLDIIEITKANGRYAAMAQSVEHVLGKDGVGSSNLPSSSKEPLEMGGFLLFSIDFDR